MNPLRLGIFSGLKQLKDERAAKSRQAQMDAERAEDRRLAKEDRERRREQDALTLDMLVRGKGYVPESEATGPNGMLDPMARDGAGSVSGESLDKIVGAASGMPTMGMSGVSPRYQSGPQGYKYDRMSPAAEDDRLEGRLKRATVVKAERDARGGGMGRLVKVMRDGKPVYVTEQDAVGQTPATEPGEAPDFKPLLSQYNSDPIVRNSAAVIEGFKKVRAAATNPSPAGDMSLVFGFMKMLDPGSTVREGEYANAQNTAGVPDRVRNLYNKALAGETLGPAQRADFLNQAKLIVQSQSELHKSVRDRYSGIATRHGVNPADVVFDPFTGLLDEPKAGGAAPTPPATWLENRRRGQR